MATPTPPPASGVQIPSSRQPTAKLDDDDQQGAKRKEIHQQLRSWGAKRARTALSVVPAHRRECAHLPDGPAGLIAERVLAGDVADYIRFRAVCTAWRRCAADPREHSSLDSRFLPRRWVILRPVGDQEDDDDSSQPAAPHRRWRFMNIATGQCVQMDLRPDIQGHRVFGPTAEGLLVLVNDRTTAVRLLNPFTRQLTELPSLATKFRYAGDLDDGGDLSVCAAGLAGEGMVALYFSKYRSRKLAVAKAGGEEWMVIDHRSWFSSLLSFAGRFYCLSGGDVMTVDTSGNQPPRLVVAAQLLDRHFQGPSSALHLVENGRELMLLNSTPLSSKQYKQYEVKVYRVDLDARKTMPIYGPNGQDVFTGRFRAVKVFASTHANRMYPCLEMSPELIGYYKTEAYHLSNHRFEPFSNLPMDDGSMCQGIRVRGLSRSRLVIHDFLIEKSWCAWS